MSTPVEPITTYQIIKDVIIPGLGVLSTITIGVVIAVILKRREENSKIKSILIDNYMEYLNKRSKFVEYESLIYTHEILKDIYINYNNYFENHSNRHLPMEQVKNLRDSFRQQLDTYNHEEVNWSPYTYKFCFLLGTKTYKKEAQGLENEIVKHIVGETSRLKFISELKIKITENNEIKQNMNALNLSKITNGLDLIVRLITLLYNDYQLKNFKPYDNLIADLIDDK